jgi:hypothetical protein
MDIKVIPNPTKNKNNPSQKMGRVIALTIAEARSPA